MQICPMQKGAALSVEFVDIGQISSPCEDVRLFYNLT